MTTGRTGRWVHATTHRGVPGEDPLPHPRPPWERIDESVAGYLGPGRRAGQSLLPTGTRPGHEEIMRQAGFTGLTRSEVGGDEIVDRGVEDIIAAVFSLSSSAPHLFAAQMPTFEADLRRLLMQASDSGRFCERTREIAVVVWRP